MDRKIYQFRGIDFNVGSQYVLQKMIGSGAYGHVVLAIDTKNQNKVLDALFFVLNKQVALKKIKKISNHQEAIRVLREITIQKNINHQNILKLYNCEYDNTLNVEKFADIYLISQYYPADLYKIIRSGQSLTVEHLRYIIYQLCLAIYYLHSAKIIHRDIKPSNILATEKCDIVLCDFGLARMVGECDEINKDFQMTEYVVTRYYRAPEIMLSSYQYTQAIDIWSLGCTFAELMTGKILFQGSNYIQMVRIIFEKLGKPSQEDLNELVNNQEAEQFVKSLPNTEKKHISNTINYPDKDAIDLLNKMLEYNPKKRITAKQVPFKIFTKIIITQNIIFTKCLDHEFFQKIRKENKEIQFSGVIQCSQFEEDQDLSLSQIYKLIIEQINQFRIQFNQEQINIADEILRISQIEHELLQYAQ